MQAKQQVSTHRIHRLAQTRCLLGEPDIISIRQVKIASSLFGKEKKVQDIQENYINGLIFPTTAHFSSFISSRYKVKDPNKHHIKAKLYMFDAYGERDILIQISIPGSMQTKAFNLHGQPLPFNSEDYQRAYYSSFLRSLYPMNYNQIVLYPLMNRIQILKPVIRNFIIFSFQHQLREMDYQFDIFRRKNQQGIERHNLSLEILIHFLLQNSFGNLLKIVLEELRRQKSPRYGQLLIEWKLKEKKYGQIIFQTAEKLLMHSHANYLKEYQVKALFQMKKFSEVAFVGRSLLQSGGTTPDVLKLLLNSLIQLGQDHRYLKTLNLIYNLHNNEEKKWQDVSHISTNKQIIDLQQQVKKRRCLSEYSEICFPFDNSFLNKLTVYQEQKILLHKNSKQGFTLSMLEKVEKSLSNSPPYYENLVLYVKCKGWNNIVKHRAECFWLQSDFVNQEEQIKQYNLDNSDRYSFFEEKYERSPPPELEQEQFDMPEPVQRGKDSEQKRDKDKDIQTEEDYDGKMSQYECSKVFKEPPKCSARVLTARKVNKNERSLGAKVQCNVHLQQMFFVLFNDLKLVNSLESWEQKLNDSDSSIFSRSKRDIAAIILMKKGFLHLKLLQNKQCQQAFQRARNMADSTGIKIVACYQLIILYIRKKNVGGVQFYLVHLLKLFKILGVQVFDIVPEWARPILQFVLQNEGLSIIKNIHPVFKGVFSMFLRSNWSEQQVNEHIKVKK